MDSEMEIDSINDIVQLAELNFFDWHRFGNVYVKAEDDLLLFNYSAKAAYAGRWNFFECVSRGLMINGKTGEIVARPFDKFFNWGEGGRTTTAPVMTIMEKMDGSLGILYRVGDNYRIATRGSFNSDQAKWATSYLNQNFNLDDLPNELTLLFEIIYPDNRIVVDYGDFEGLLLLGARERTTGKYLHSSAVKGLAAQYGFPTPRVYEFFDIDELIENIKVLDTDIEGYVVEFGDGQRFKFKGKRYIELHRIISNLTFKVTLREMQNDTLLEFLAFVPDEFLHDVYRWIELIQLTIRKVCQEVGIIFDDAPKNSRKEFAQWVMKNHKPLSTYLFAKLDGKEIEPIIYSHYDWTDVEEDKSDVHE